MNDAIDWPMRGTQSVIVTFLDRLRLLESPTKLILKLPCTRYYHLMENLKNPVVSRQVGTSGKGLSVLSPD